MEGDAIAEKALSEQFRQQEQEKARAIAEADTKHQQELADAKASRDRTIADLRSGTIKLRDEWAVARQIACPVPPQVPADLMTPPKGESVARDVFLKP